MKDCEKIIVVLYIPISCGMEDFASTYKHLTEYFDDTVKALAIPTTEGDAHIDVLNPRYIPEDEYKALVEHFDNELVKLRENMNI